MNYGFVAVGRKGDLSVTEEPCQHGIQLYDRVVGTTDIAGKDVLEVGSGRGGGIFYIMKTKSPARAVGIDLCKLSVEISTRTFPLAGLQYLKGDAEDLPVPSLSFDVVVNVESSHCYPNFIRFAREVSRVLRPKGKLVFADFGSPDRLARDTEILRSVGLRQLEAEDITAGVLRALGRDDVGKRKFFSSICDNEDRLEELLSFGRCIGTEGYEAFRSGREIYMRYVFEKE